MHQNFIPQTGLSYNPQNDSGFGLFPFRSPLLREYQLVSFPPGTEMFHFPGYALSTILVLSDLGSPRPGFPIRRSRDQRFLGTSPELIAA
jgi:hypothetical protein